MQMLVPGRLITWTAPGPFGMELRSYAYRRGETLVWIDPVEPGPKDRMAVTAFGKPAHILLTFGAHARGTEVLRKLFDCEVWVPAVEGGDRYIERPDHTYSWQTELPAMLRAVHIPGVGLGEHAIVGDLDGRRFAFVGDSVIHMKERTLVGRLVLGQPRGALQHKRFYFQWGGNKKTALKETKRLMSLELEMLFPTHGAPIMHDARGMLRESLSAW